MVEKGTKPRGTGSKPEIQREVAKAGDREVRKETFPKLHRGAKKLKTSAGKTAAQLMNEGKALLNDGRHKKALEALEEALRLDPNLAKAWYGKGIALDDMGRLDEALKAYDKAIELNPKLAEAWNNKGVTLDKMGRSDEALKAYDKAIELNPKLAEAWNNKGNMLGKMGRHDEALKAYDKAIELNPKFVVAWRSKAETLVAICGVEKANEARAQSRRIHAAYEADECFKRAAWLESESVGKKKTSE